jgi:hypothetical protein
MNITERREAAGALKAILSALQNTVRLASLTEAATLRQTAGALAARVDAAVEGYDFGRDLRTCFEAATAAGASFAEMSTVCTVAQALSPVYPAGALVAATGVRLALVEMCRILARSTFTSRQEVETALVRINAAFEPAEEYAADQRQASVYRALVALHGATVRDLTQRSRPLPRMTTYAFSRRRPVLAIAQRLYGDASRADELRSENKTVHPLFMPASGRALSA